MTVLADGLGLKVARPMRARRPHPARAGKAGYERELSTIDGRVAGLAEARLRACGTSEVYPVTTALDHAGKLLRQDASIGVGLEKNRGREGLPTDLSTVFPQPVWKARR